MSNTKDGGQNWLWWSSFDEESYSGPFHSREQAIAELDGDAGWVAEAHKASLRLSDFIDADDILERADSSADDYVGPDGDPIFDPSPEQTHDLLRRIKRVCDEWQDAHGIKFITWSFSGMRNKERIAAREGGAA